MEGTIIRTKSGEKFSKTVDDWQFIPGVLPSIKRFAEGGYLICIVSNEGGIEMGHVTNEFINTKYSNIQKEIEAYIRTDINIVYCQALDHYDRKPNPGMAYYLARELSIDLKQSVMVGDSESDKDFAFNAGITGFLRVEQFVEREVK